MQRGEQARVKPLIGAAVMVTVGAVAQRLWLMQDAEVDAGAPRPLGRQVRRLIAGAYCLTRGVFSNKC